MFVKRSGKTIFGAELNAAERKAADMEARRILAEHTRKYELEIEAVVIRQLKQLTDMDDEELRRFYDGFTPELMSLVEHYEMPEEDAPWLCTMALKREGIDIEQWHRERYPNERYDI